jgi:hypothetical protein
MDDQRIVGGSPLGFEDAANRRPVECVRPKTVDRLSWKRDKTTLAKHLGRPRDRGTIWRV